ncbi:MAG: hypothetical protein PVG03_16930 [Desulfarculaceae bacterium]|jgi:hypothetical protein
MSAKQHLAEEQIIAAALNEPGLPQEVAEHLKACPDCAAQAEQIASQVAGLGKMSRDLAPAPPRRFTLPDRQPSLAGRWAWRLPLAAGMAAACVFLFSLWLGPGQRQPSTLSNESQAMFSEDQPLSTVMAMEDVETFSPFQAFVLGETYLGLDQDFMDFVSPSSDEDVSAISKEGRPC